jgi:hypothetical protein
VFFAEFFKLVPRRAPAIRDETALTERAEGADDIPVVLAAGFLTVGSHEAVALFRPRVAEVVILFPGVEEIVIVNRAELVFPGSPRVSLTKVLNVKVSPARRGLWRR